MHLSSQDKVIGYGTWKVFILNYQSCVISAVNELANWQPCRNRRKRWYFSHSLSLGRQCIWNSLPPAMGDYSFLLNTFKQKLKTHLFGQWQTSPDALHCGVLWFLVPWYKILVFLRRISWRIWRNFEVSPVCDRRNRVTINDADWQSQFSHWKLPKCNISENVACILLTMRLPASIKNHNVSCHFSTIVDDFDPILTF